MKFGNLVKMLVVLVVLTQADLSFGLEIYDSNYVVEEYFRYNSSQYVEDLAFDLESNLYIAQEYNGKIIKVTPDKQGSFFATGFNRISDITWSSGGAYGDNLYVLESGDPEYHDRIYKVDMSGTISSFADMSSPFHRPTAIGISESDSYGDQMFVGTGSLDCLATVSLSGSVSQFGSWPGQTDGGSIQGIAFDDIGNYGNSMFVSTDYYSDKADKAGVFKVDSNGNATRFSTIPLRAEELLFDTSSELLFGGKLYAVGNSDFTSPAADMQLWQIDESGEAILFGKVGRSVTFGNDGAMYVAENVGTEVIVSRVSYVPEPGTISLIVVGGMALVRRKIK